LRDWFKKEIEEHGEDLDTWLFLKNDNDDDDDDDDDDDCRPAPYPYRVKILGLERPSSSPASRCGYNP
jgi:hypothetical protein